MPQHNAVLQQLGFSVEPEEEEQEGVIVQSDSVLSALGFSVPGMQTTTREGIDEEDKEGFFVSGAKGILSGLLDPVGIIPGVGGEEGLLSRLEPQEGSVAGGVGHAIGFLGGFLLPSTLALKAATVGLKSVGVLSKFGRVLETADTFRSLGFAKDAARGAVAGSILGIGRHAEDTDERVRNVLTEAALFGVGDAIGHAVFGAITGSTLDDSLRENALKMAEEFIANKGVIQSADVAEMVARAHNTADRLFPAELMKSERSVRQRRALLNEGLENLAGTKELKAGEITVVDLVTTNTSDINRVMRGIKDVRFAKIPVSLRGTGPDLATSASRRGDRVGTDVLIALKAGIDDKTWRVAVDTFRQNAARDGVGWLPGQRIIVNGSERVLLRSGPNPGKVYASNPANLNKSSLIDPTKHTFMPTAAWMSGGGLGKRAGTMWSDFSVRFGIFPEEGFEPAFNQFVVRNKLRANETAELRGFFARRMFNELETLDPRLTKVLTNLKLIDTTVMGTHPAGDTRVLAAQQGYLLDGITDADGVSSIVLRDVMDGTVLPFEKEAEVLGYISKRRRILEDLVPEMRDSPFPFGDVGLGGVFAQFPHTAGGMDGVKFPLWIAGTKSITPRIAWFRDLNDFLVRNHPDIAKDLPIIEVARDVVAGNIASQVGQKRWVNDLIKIFGPKLRPHIRPERMKPVWELMQEPRSTWGTVSERLALSNKEVNAAEGLSGYWDDLLKEFGAELPIKTDEFLKDYIGVVSNQSMGKGGAYWQEGLKNAHERLGIKTNQKVLDFMTEMEGAGVSIGRFAENDPYLMTLQYTRELFTRRHVSGAYKKMRELITKLPNDGESDLFRLRQSLSDFMSTSYHNTPEAYWVAHSAMRGVFDKLDIQLQPGDLDRYINTAISLNYGAFMGFRPALAIRNLTQLLVTTLPMVGPKYMAIGIRDSLKHNAKAGAIKAGSVPVGSVAAPFTDMLASQSLANRVSSQVGKGKSAPLRWAFRAADIARDVSDFGIRGEVQVGGKTLPVGLFSAADEFNRTISHYAQRAKTIDAYNKWRGPGGHGDLRRFNNESGLRQFGEATEVEFHKRLVTEWADDSKKAADWMGSLLSGETQWIYQAGAGPALFSHGAGRLFGMYGTWAAWMVTHLKRGATKGSVEDRVRFAGWTAAISATFASSAWWTAKTIGVPIDLGRWSGLTSMDWTGGPAFDWFKDITDIIGGKLPGGGSTATRQLALGQKGLKDVGGEIPGLPTALTDVATAFIPGVGIESTTGIPAPLQAGLSVLANFTPGYLQFRDFQRAAESDNPIITATGFKIAGAGWPGITPARGRRPRREGR